jgi:hypothetical protein
VTNHEDQLRRAFATHEDQTPDPAAVYARVQELSRSYKWRRRGAQAAGGAVLSAGLIAGVVNLPAVLPAGPATPGSDSSARIQAAAPATASTASSPPSQEELEKEWVAYFAAGYDYDDAVRLAKLWHLSGGIAEVKAEAGRRLLAGETLPFPATPDPVVEEPADTQAEIALAAFFRAGYDWDDAVRLAKLWKKSDPFDAKVLAGKKLLAGETLPIQP